MNTRQELKFDMIRAITVLRVLSNNREKGLRRVRVSRLVQTFLASRSGE